MKWYAAHLHIRREEKEVSVLLYDNLLAGFYNFASQRTNVWGFEPHKLDLQDPFLNGNSEKRVSAASRTE